MPSAASNHPGECAARLAMWVSIGHLTILRADVHIRVNRFVGRWPSLLTP